MLKRAKYGNKEKRLQKATNELEKAVIVDSTDPYIWYYLGKSDKFLDLGTVSHYFCTFRPFYSQKYDLNFSEKQEKRGKTKTGFHVFVSREMRFEEV